MLSDDEVVHELYLHLLWSTKNQQSLISETMMPGLYRFACDVMLSTGNHLIAGQIFSDHLQFIVKFTPDIAYTDLVITLKTATTLWLRSNFPEMKEFEWQKADFSFTLSTGCVTSLAEKIRMAKTFCEEIYPILDAHELQYDRMEILE